SVAVAIAEDFGSGGGAAQCCETRARDHPAAGAVETSAPAHHRYPHPFPTRRSSDLDARPASAWAICSCTRSSRTARSRRPACARSEEHTSELQSLAYLVCRLLLETKNLDRAAYAGDGGTVRRP